MEPDLSSQNPSWGLAPGARNSPSKLIERQSVRFSPLLHSYPDSGNIVQGTPEQIHVFFLLQ